MPAGNAFMRAGNWYSSQNEIVPEIENSRLIIRRLYSLVLANKVLTRALSASTTSIAARQPRY